MTASAGVFSNGLIDSSTSAGASSLTTTVGGSGVNVFSTFVASLRSSLSGLADTAVEDLVILFECESNANVG